MVDDIQDVSNFLVSLLNVFSSSKITKKINVSENRRDKQLLSIFNLMALHIRSTEPLIKSVKNRDRRDCDGIAVGFTTTCAFSAYHH
jgi:hypothetical protein